VATGHAIELLLQLREPEIAAPAQCPERIDLVAMPAGLAERSDARLELDEFGDFQRMGRDVVPIWRTIRFSSLIVLGATGCQPIGGGQLAPSELPAAG